MKEYFAYDQDGSMEFFDTQSQAVAFCEAAISEVREADPEDGFGDDVLICWGKVIQVVEEVRVGDKKQYIDYELRNIT